MKELYHEEQQILSDYVGKVKKKNVNLEDAVGIAVDYKDLLDQSKVITRISGDDFLDVASRDIQSTVLLRADAHPLQVLAQLDFPLPQVNRTLEVLV